MHENGEIVVIIAGDRIGDDRGAVRILVHGDGKAVVIGHQFVIESIDLGAALRFL